MTSSWQICLLVVSGMQLGFSTPVALQVHSSYCSRWFYIRKVKSSCSVKTTPGRKWMLVFPRISGKEDNVASLQWFIMVVYIFTEDVYPVIKQQCMYNYMTLPIATENVIASIYTYVADACMHCVSYDLFILLDSCMYADWLTCIQMLLVPFAGHVMFSLLPRDSFRGELQDYFKQIKSYNKLATMPPWCLILLVSPPQDLIFWNVSS